MAAEVVAHAVMLQWRTGHAEAHDRVKGKRPLFPYLCGVCSKWHITSKPQFADMIEARA